MVRGGGGMASPPASAFSGGHDVGKREGGGWVPTLVAFADMPAETTS